MARINYLELPVASTAEAKTFWSAAFGWSFTDFGPTYAATTGEHADLGFQATRLSGPRRSCRSSRSPTWRRRWR